MGQTLSRDGVAFAGATTACLTQRIPGVTPSEAFAAYWEEFSTCHPYTVALTVHTKDAAAQSFTATDRVPLPFIGCALTVTVDANMRVTRQTADLIEVEAFGRASATRVHTTVRLRGEEGGCLVEEDVRFVAFWPVLWIVRRQGLAAHERVWRVLATRLQSRGGGATPARQG